MMIIFLYEGRLGNRETTRSNEWFVLDLYESSIKLLSGRVIQTTISTPTFKALWKRNIAMRKGKRWTPSTPRLTKHGLFVIRQQPEYGELMALRTIDDL